MPSKPLKPCTRPGCPRLTIGGLCPEHRQQAERAYEQTRGTATERGYTAAWHKARDWKIRHDPLCEPCLTLGIDRAAVLVHHRDRDPRNNQPDNLVSMCLKCHEREHRVERWG